MNIVHQSMAVKEAFVLTEIKHDNVVRIHQWEKAGDSNDLLLVLEYCSGGDLNDLIKERVKAKN